MELITAADVRRLLDSDDDNPTLVVSEGQAMVIGRQEAEAGDYAGALLVTDRRQLRATVTDLDLEHASATDLQALAERLNAAVTNLGG
jgi:predicted polyphosphate/ATP-dependent NAD kinase